MEWFERIKMAARFSSSLKNPIAVPQLERLKHKLVFFLSSNLPGADWFGGLNLLVQRK